jgi:SAM-dependent methyltransferase
MGTLFGLPTAASEQIDNKVLKTCPNLRLQLWGGILEEDMKQEPVTCKAKTIKRKADQYNDPSHNYLRYWDGRDYEHAAEELAIRRLVRDRHFKHAVDVGGGYGRLCVLLEQFADAVTLAEPSQQQLDIAKEFLHDHPKVDRKLLQAADLKFKDSSVDLLTMVRVMHHLPDPAPEFAEIARVLSSDGYAIIEVANYVHARNRIKHVLRGKKMPIKPVDIRSAENRTDQEIPFVNHNPETVIKQLAHAGLRVERTLSVSNLRSPSLKKIMPKNLMLVMENALQVPLSSSYFGPSIFFFVRKG